MALSVGDLVEVVQSKLFPKAVGHRATIIGFRPSVRWPGISVVRILPDPFGLNGAWHPACLRKINPPDWEAPRAREAELTK